MNGSLRVLTVHNYYQQPGGEDQVYQAERQLLESRGHFVSSFVVRNDQIEGMSKAKLALRTIWNGPLAGKLAKSVRDNAIDIIHFHNTFPLVSPAAYHATAKAGAAVVQSLHNYRLVCPAATLFRDGACCRLCLDREAPWPGVVHSCYRDDRAATLVTAAMTQAHRAMRTYRQQVHAYIAPTAFVRQAVLSQAPGDRVHVKPHFVDPVPPETPAPPGEPTALFVGRLTEEKGVRTLIDAWTRHNAMMPLRVAGDGPLGNVMRDAANACERITWLGRINSDDVADEMAKASLLIVPSVWHEPFGMVVIEAFARGVPVAASVSGGLRNLVTPGVDGWRLPPGDSAALAQLINRIHAHPEEAQQLRAGARQSCVKTYTADANYPRLMEIYAKAIDVRDALRGRKPASVRG